MKVRFAHSRLLARYPLVFLEVVLRSLLISIALRISPIPRIGNYCARPRRFIRRRRLDPHLVHRLSMAIESRLPGRASCLRSSLVLFSMIPRDARWIVGVDKQSRLLEAHAWVEAENKVFSGSLDWNRYRSILSVHK